MKKLLVLVFSIFLTSSSFADTTNFSGYVACGKLLSACDESKMDFGCLVPTIWAQGYISSVIRNTNFEVPFKYTNHETMKHALITYCRQNPSKDNFDAVIDIAAKTSTSD